MVQSPAASASPAAVAAAAAPTDEAFNRLVHKYHMFGLWEQEEGVEPVPFPKTEAFMWPASIVNQLIEQAGHAVPVGNERRALQLFNPGFGGQFATTPTLVGAVQVLLPGETARAHRHSASAIRFITRGSGAYTRVNGERLYMSEGDLVLTPNWTWHDHNNDAAAPVVWMDGLDVPLVKYLDAWFFELYPDRQAADLLPPGISRRLYGHASLKPTWRQEQPSHSPLMLYSWRQTSEALAALRAGVHASAQRRASHPDDVVLDPAAPPGPAPEGPPSHRQRGVLCVQGQRHHGHRRSGVQLDRGELHRLAAVVDARAHQHL
jgi:gentisate 1,2-dioxygenase